MSTLIGNRIRELRLKSGLTQTQLAQDIVTPSMISQIEAGKAHPSSTLLRKLAHRLGAPEDILLDSPIDDESTLANLEVMQACVEFQLYHEAETLIEEALVQPQGHYVLYDLLGKVLLAKHDLQGAARAFDQAMSVAREQLKFDSIPELYLLQGDVHTEAGNIEAAAHLYELALISAKEHAPLNGLLEAEIAIRLSKTYTFLHQNEKAQNYAAYAEERATLGSHSKELAKQQVQESVAHLAKGNTFEARRLSLEARSIFKVFHWLESSVEATLILAQQFMDQNEYSKALGHLEQLTVHAQTYLDKDHLARILFMQNQALFGLGQHKEALLMVQRGLSLTHMPSVEAGQATLRGSQSAHIMDDHETAFSLAQKACEISTERQNLRLISEAFSWMAKLYHEAGDLQKADDALTAIETLANQQKERSRVDAL